MTEASLNPLLPSAAVGAVTMVVEWWSSRAVILTACRGRLSPIEDSPFFFVYVHEFGGMDSYFLKWVLSRCYHDSFWCP